MSQTTTDIATGLAVPQYEPAPDLPPRPAPAKTFDFGGAERARATPRQVVEFLAPQVDFRLEDARKSGASDQQIYDFMRNRFDVPAKPPTPGEGARRVLSETGQNVYGLARGGVAGLLGAPGALEEFGAYTVPRALGFEAPDRRSPTGGRTLFPTPEEVNRALPGPRAEGRGAGFESLGEVIGGFGTPSGVVRAGQGLASAGRGVASAARPITETVRRARGGEATAAGEDMVAAIRGQGEGVATARTAEEAALLAEQAARRGRVTQLTDEAAQAEQQAARATQAELQAGEGLAGVRTVNEFGQSVLRPQTLDEIGTQFLRTPAAERFATLRAERSAAAESNLTAAREAAAAREVSEPFVASSPMQELQGFITRNLNTETDPTLVNQLRTVQRALFEGTENARPSFASSETIRRKLGDAAFGAPEEGYQAIGQQLARDLYTRLSGAMREYEPAFGQYLDSYRQLSEPLRVAASRLGKALTGTEVNAPSYFSAPAQSLPGRAFSSPENVRGLMDALGGREPVLAAAERYFATQLVGKTAAEARQYLGSDKVRAVLEVLGPEFRAQLNSRFLEGATRQAETAASATATAARLRQEVTVLEREITSIGQEINKIAPVRENVNRDLANIRNALNSADRNKFSSQLLSRIENELDSVTYTRMTNLVNQYKTATTQQQEAVRRLRSWALKAGTAIGLGGVGGAYFFGGR
jgi:hypothetical protein